MTEIPEGEYERPTKSLLGQLPDDSFKKDDTNGEASVVPTNKRNRKKRKLSPSAYSGTSMMLRSRRKKIDPIPTD